MSPSVRLSIKEMNWKKKFKSLSKWFRGPDSAVMISTGKIEKKENYTLKHNTRFPEAEEVS